MQTINSKLPHIGTTIFTKMSKLATEYNAENLSQGFPNFKADTNLLELVNKAMKDNLNQYAPLAGLPELNEAVLQKTNNLYGSQYTQEEICITAGATQAIFTSLAASIHPGDEVIVFKPAYDCYEPAVELFGGKSIPIEMKAPDYKIDWNEVQSKMSPKTKMILINSPHNPTGKVFTEDDMKALSLLTEYTDILILSDEVYEHMTFDGRPHLSIANYPELKERSFITASFGKTFHVTGWKLGYVLAPKNLMKEFKKIHQYNVFCVNHPMQVAISQYIKDKNTYLSIPKFYQQKRDYFLSLLKDSRFKCIPTEGTYFQMADYSAISDEKDTDFTLRMIKEYGLAAIPVSVFNKDQKCHKMIRFCFAKTDETLEKAAEIINRI
jgi:methionine aminotransferase